jgi:hypothetical protein
MPLNSHINANIVARRTTIRDKKPVCFVIYREDHGFLTFGFRQIDPRQKALKDLAPGELPDLGRINWQQFWGGRSDKPLESIPAAEAAALKACQPK